MKVKLFFKEYFSLILFFIIILLFIFSVSFFDAKIRMSSSNFLYMIISIFIMFFIYLIIDFSIKYHKLKQFQKLTPEELTENDIKILGFYNEYMKTIIRFQNESNQIIQTLNKQKDKEMDFVLSWAHDIKIPLSAMKLILENNQDQIDYDIFKSTENQILKIEHDIDKILYYIRLNDFNQDYIVANVNIKKIIYEQLKQYSKFFSYKKLKLNMKNIDHIVLSDEKWLGFIINQLLSNAIKYADENGSIDIFCINDNHSIILTVQNTGIGIKKEDIPRIFNRGFTGYIGRQGNKATGYGLYLSKKLSDKLNHKLYVNSIYGETTSFYLDFSKKDTLYNITKM
ncbi:MAG: sensor histidine kinase [Eubacteriaceae bacterium]